jgi:thiamine-phosphate pyrophosphorylase
MGTGRGCQWRLCVLLSEELCRRPWDDVLAAIIDAGVDCIQIREKSMPSGALADRARRVLAAARPSGVAVIVNDRPDVAMAVEADGVHLGQEDLTVSDVRRLAGRRLLVGVSTHDLREARVAVEAGADYCGVGAMFATSLKPSRAPSGPGYLREFVERYPRVPHLAIGGVTLEKVESLIDAGARGLAVSTAVCAADDPGAVTRRLLKLMTPTPSPAAPESPSP